MSMAKTMRVAELLRHTMLTGAAILPIVSAIPSAHAQFTANVDVSSLGGPTGFQLVGGSVSARIGSSVDAGGDYNGDGIADVLIGSNGTSAAYVVFGSSSSSVTKLGLTQLDGNDGFRVVAPPAILGVGADASSAGDINADGIDDILISSAAEDTQGTDAGAAYVVFGRKTPFDSVIELSALNGQNGIRILGSVLNEHAGVTVNGLGDVNGDGVEDFALGASGSVPTVSGGAYVVFGRKAAFPSLLQLSALNGANGFKLRNGVGEGNAGHVTGAGDVNGDGQDDIIVSGLDTAYVVFGKSGSFPSSIDLSGMASSRGFRIVAEIPGISTGRVVSGAGDVNGDGRDDLLISANDFAVGPAQVGAVYVVLGKASGFGSAVQLSSLDGNNGFRLQGSFDDDETGLGLAGGGDFNGDGYDDVVAATPLLEGYVTGNGGGANVVFGKFGGFDASIQMSALNGENGFLVRSEESSARLGEDSVAAGDVNGDGIDDVIIGSYRSDDGAANAGSVYVIFGRLPVQSVARVGSLAGQYINGGQSADGLAGSGGNDVLEGRGSGDLLDGGSGSNTASYEHSAEATVASLANPAVNTFAAAGDQYFNIQNLLGSPFSDKLTGNNADNRLTGGRLSDFLKGGKGKDTFVYGHIDDSGPGPAADIVIDFKPGTASTAVDRIDVSGIDADTSKPGNQKFKFIGTNAISGKAQLRLKKTSAGIVVQGNTGGSKAAEFEILLKGLKKTSAFTAKDFKL